MKHRIATTISQSKKLLELGLDPETAGLVYPAWTISDEPIEDICEIRKHDLESEHDVPAWSLADLLELMPKLESKEEEITGAKIMIIPVVGKASCYYINTSGGIYKQFDAADSIDAAFEMVVYLLEHDYLKKE